MVGGKNQWSEEEEMKFIQAHQTIGNRWSEISKFLPGRADNTIKNHFYSSLRKNISRMSKDIITPDQKLSKQARDNSIYLIDYLRRIFIQEQQDDEEWRNGGNPVGKNDKYLVGKLKQYQITLEKIDLYMGKL